MAALGAAVVATLLLPLRGPGSDVHVIAGPAVPGSAGSGAPDGGQASASSVPGPCAGTGGTTYLDVLAQAPDGHLSGCWRVPGRSPGIYDAALTKSFPFARAGSAPGRLGPAASLRLSPASGPPGTRITVTGELASPRPGQMAGPAMVCWDGCRRGLSSLSEPSTSPFRWLSPTSFTATLVAPSAPWLEGGTPQPLVSGAYRIAVACLGPVAGRPAGSKQMEKCMMGASEGSATFQLTVAHPIACDRAHPCSALSFSPPAAEPGQFVSVSGRAPITRAPAAYGLALARRPGSAPAGSKGEVVLPGARLRVKASPTWAALGRFHPGAVASGSLPPVSASAGHPSTVAACDAGSLQLSRDGGSSWSSMPAPSPAVLPAGLSPGRRYGQAGPPRAWACQAAMIDPSNPAVVYAAYPVIPVVTPAGKPGIAPPGLVAVLSADAGASWKLVPTPAGARTQGFARFAVRGGSVLALYLPAVYGGAGVQAPLVEETSSSGSTWSQSSLSCPSWGPCVAFGAAPAPPPPMGVPPVPDLLASFDQARSWSPVEPFGHVVQNDAQVMALGADRAVLVEDESSYPVLLTTDGGRNWHYLQLPALPGTAGLPAGPATGTITALGTGDLLASTDTTAAHWWLLRPGASGWCPLRAGLLPSTAFLNKGPLTAGVDLWWETGTGGPSQAGLQHLALSRLACG